MGMDFADKLKQFSKRIDRVKDSLSTEEATKTALILPFFQLLDYDIFAPDEFVPEFIADVVGKKGEKVDYAIMRNGKPIILIEAKSVDDDLNKHDAQLFRYFTATEAKFAILTNGIKYKFFTDLEEKNKMDEKAFMEVNLMELNEVLIQEIKKFKKENFDIETIFNTASELKYTGLVKVFLNKQLNLPTDEFVKFVISDFYQGIKTQNVIDKFRPIVKKSFQQFINDFINEKIQALLSEETDSILGQDDNAHQVDADYNMENLSAKGKIITTDEEKEAFVIIREILKEKIDVEYITYKDVESYFGILYMNNTRKWICRLYLDVCKKYIVFNDKEKVNIDSIKDLYNYKDRFIRALDKYLNEGM